MDANPTQLQTWAAEFLGLPIDEAPRMALSLREPWCHFIIDHGKRVENRVWRSQVSGWVFMHASGGGDLVEYGFAVDFACLHGGDDGEGLPERAEIMEWKDIKRGGITGAMKIAPSVSTPDAPWAMEGQFQIPILEARRLPFIPCSGAQRWFLPKAAPPGQTYAEPENKEDPVVPDHMVPPWAERRLWRCTAPGKAANSGVRDVVYLSERGIYAEVCKAGHDGGAWWVKKDDCRNWRKPKK